MTKRRHMRDGDRLDDDSTIVIRGGVLDAASLRTDAQRYHDIYGEPSCSTNSSPVSRRSSPVRISDG